MTVLYRKPCYSEGSYNEVDLYLVTIYHPFKYLFGICLCSLLICLLNLQILAQNDIFFDFSLFFRPFL